MAEHRGSTLRAARESVGVALGRVARHGHVSVGHLSRVERGERPVTPAIVAVYRQALGISLVDERQSQVDGRQVEDAGVMRRRAFNATIAAIAVGGPLAEPVERLLDKAGGAASDKPRAAASGAPGPVRPTRVGLADVIQVEEAEDMFTAWHLRFGGGLAGELAQSHLRAAVGLLDATMTEDVRRRLQTAIGTLATRAAWTMFDSGRADAARSLFTIALHAATEARHVDLRVGILGEVATQQFYLGQVDDALEITRLAAGDERACPAVRFALHTVNARAYGTMGDAAQCWRQIGLAEEEYARVRPETTPSWMTRFFDDGHLHGMVGQAAFALARATEGSGRSDAQAYTRLGQASEHLDADVRGRSMALCTTRLATLHLARGDLDEGVRVAGQALAAARGVRSARIAEDVRVMRVEAAARGMRALTDEIDLVLAA